jgi:hypothetical protein
MNRLTRFWQDVTGHSQDRFVALLEQQIDAVLGAIELARSSLTDNGDTRATEFAALEQRGDDRRAEVVRELSRSLTTPIDREDVFRLSRSIDDVLDNLRDFMRELTLYAPSGRDRFDDILQAVRQGMQALRDAIAGFAESPSVALEASQGARDGASLARRRYEDAMACLLHGELDMDVLRQRELLRRLDVVGLRLGEAASALADGALKRAE